MLPGASAQMLHSTTATKNSICFRKRRRQWQEQKSSRSWSFERNLNEPHSVLPCCDQAASWRLSALQRYCLSLPVPLCFPRSRTHPELRYDPLCAAVKGLLRISRCKQKLELPCSRLVG